MSHYGEQWSDFADASKDAYEGYEHGYNACSDYSPRARDNIVFSDGREVLVLYDDIDTHTNSCHA